MTDRKFGLFDPNDEDIIKLIPSIAKRVKVKDIDGQEKWRDPKAFEAGDMLILENGEPRVMMSTPGRKSKKEEYEEVCPESVTEDADEKRQLKKKFVENDSLFRATKENPDDDKLLGKLLEGLAEEAASLSFERSQKEARNQETSQTSLRRVNTLRAMAEIYLKQKEQQAAAVIDLRSPQFFVLFQYIIETFKSAMEVANLDQDAISIVMDNLISAVKEEAWTGLAIRKMKGE